MNCLVLAVAALAASAPSADPALEQLLRAKDQALLDAVAPGDEARWDRTLAADAIYVDENGVIFRRAELLKTVRPLPPGISGRIEIIDYEVKRSGDTAIVIHRDAETENFHGQALSAEYLMTEVWRLEDEWKLAFVHAYAVLKDPPAIVLPDSLLAAYVGRYRAGADMVYAISLRDGQLSGGVEGSSSTRPMRVELADVLFIPGQPRSRKIFQRDAAGAVVGYLERREGRDLVWTRIGEGRP